MRIFDGGLGNKPRRRSRAVLQEIEAYWEALREERDMPLRTEVDPRGIERALRHAFVLERMAPGMARIRVAGGVFSDLMGMETRGMPISTLFGPDARQEFREVLENVFSGPSRARLQLSGERGFGRPALTGEMILLPLRSFKGDVTRVLGGLEVDGQMGATPRRFSLSSSFQKSLRGGDVRIESYAGPPAERRGAADVPAPHGGNQCPIFAVGSKRLRAKAQKETAAPKMRSRRFYFFLCLNSLGLTIFAQ